MMKRGLAPHLLLMVLSCVLIIAASCSGPSVSPPSTVPAAPPSTPSSPPPTPPGAVSPATPQSGQSVDQLSQAGKTVYATSCIRCHGDKGQGVTGPAVIGPSANLGKYATAKALLTYISTIMPASAPGSLPLQSYLQLLAYLLVENKVVAPGTMLDSAQLDNIKLEK
jgi:mono/diheme cytochrome c family protein